MEKIINESDIQDLQAQSERRIERTTLVYGADSVHIKTRTR